MNELYQETNMTDYEERQVALDYAIRLYGGNGPSAEMVVAAATKFREFLRPLSTLPAAKQPGAGRGKP